MVSLTKSCRVCQTTPAHLGEMIRIANETNLSPWTAQNYLDELKTSSSLMRCLLDDSCRVIGFVVGRIVPGTTEASPDAEIYNIAMAGSHQRKGGGYNLLRSFLQECEMAGVTNVWLDVRESNTDAIGFYERNHFEKVQIRPNFYKNPIENAIVMRRKMKE